MQPLRREALFTLEQMNKSLDFLEFVLVASPFVSVCVAIAFFFPLPLHPNHHHPTYPWRLPRPLFGRRLLDQECIVLNSLNGQHSTNMLELLELNGRDFFASCLSHPASFHVLFPARRSVSLVLFLPPPLCRALSLSVSHCTHTHRHSSSSPPPTLFSSSPSHLPKHFKRMNYFWLSLGHGRGFHFCGSIVSDCHL